MSSGLQTMQDSNQSAKLQTLARLLKVYMDHIYLLYLPHIV